MKKSIINSLIISALTLSSISFAHSATIKMDCGATAKDKEYCSYIKDRFEKETGNQLEFVNLPPSADERLTLLQQLFSTKDSTTIDVFQSDSVWTGLLQKHSLDLTDAFASLENDFFPATWKNNVINDRIYAVPAFLDTGMLFYRKDLLEKYGEKVPETWEELTAISERIQSQERQTNPNFWGYVFQGKSYEGLTCNALEWVASYKGGVFVENDGSISINNIQASKAYDTAASWIGNISPEGVMGYMEEESRALFQNGDALFLRNWPSVYIRSQEEGSSLIGKVGVAQLPKGGIDGQSANTLGSENWSINAYTQHPKESIELVRILSDKEAQKMLLKIKGNSPSRPALYDDPEVLELAPHLAQFKNIFANAVARPSTPTMNQYARVSNAIYNVSYDVLRKEKNGTDATKDLESRLEKIKGKGWR